MEEEEDGFFIEEIRKVRTEMEIEVPQVKDEYVLTAENTSFSQINHNRLSNLSWIQRVTMPSSNA